MTAVVPHRFLFRYSIPVRYVARLPKKGRTLLDLPAECALPSFGELDEQRPFEQLRAAWNAGGLGFSLSVTGKKMPFSCDLDAPADSDGLQLWIDTRNTQSIHRASRFCHHFCILPAGAGTKRDRPTAVQLPIARAREETPLANPDDVRVAVERRRKGYRLEAWLPGEALGGFDPDANPLLGFYYFVRDAELGEQFLSVGQEFPFAHDPSLWSTLELIRVDHNLRVSNR